MTSLPSIISYEEAQRLGRPAHQNAHARMEQLLGRRLTATEFSAVESMESEHASYASTKQTLKKWLPTGGANHIKSIGDESAAVAIAVVNGETLTLAYGSESHNSPSYICAHPGAATGTGGDQRDRLALTANKPVALFEARRQCHPLENPHRDPVRQHTDETTRGIADYGNAMGIPHGDGSIKYHVEFSGNNLVNVMSFALAPKGRLLSNKVPLTDSPERFVGIYVGKASDRTGIGGTKFASAAHDTTNLALNEKAVQDPDPHLQEVDARGLERLVDTARDQGWLSHMSVKDMGAAGLLCSTVEQLHAGIGVVIDGNLVPQNEPRTATELLEAETQERFFIYVHEDFAERVLTIFNDEIGMPSVNVGARAAIVARCNNSGHYAFVHDGVLEVNLPAHELAEGPSFTKPVREPRRQRKSLPADGDLEAGIDLVLDSINFKSDEYVHGHYDKHIGRRNIVKRGEGAATLMSDKSLEYRFGFSGILDSGVAIGLIDPALQAEDALVRAAYRMSTVGCSIIGVTNNANFGRTDNPEELWEFEKAQEGLARACNNWLLEPRYLAEIRKDDELAERLQDDEVHLTVNSGNCSMNKANANTGTAIPPTTILGTVGWTDNPHRYATWDFKGDEGEIVLIGARQQGLGGTDYAQQAHGSGCMDGDPFTIDYSIAHSEAAAVRDAVRGGLVAAANAIEEGGLVNAVAEMLANSNECYDVSIGTKAAMGPENLTATQKLFSESHGVVVQVTPDRRNEFYELMRERGVKAYAIGDVRRGTGSLRIDGIARTQDDVRERYNKLERMLEASS